MEEIIAKYRLRFEIYVKWRNWNQEISVQRKLALYL